MFEAKHPFLIQQIIARSNQTEVNRSGVFPRQIVIAVLQRGGKITLEKGGERKYRVGGS